MEFLEKLKKYSYPLPSDKIAKFPLAIRDHSKLAVFREGKVEHHQFSQIAALLPSNSFMLFNNSKVIPSRLFFKRFTGAKIEVLALEPHSPAEYASNLSQKFTSTWKAAVRNGKRWKDDSIKFEDNGVESANQLGLTARLLGREEGSFIVQFNWESDHTFGEVLEVCGRVPIPPYLEREDEEIDKERYQTLYAKAKGSVAAPTAGLHFSENSLKGLQQKGIEKFELTLHVGAGTFLPIKSDNLIEHQMHSELITIELSDLYQLLNRVESGVKIIAVGTTSVRAVESLYWMGVKVLRGEGLAPLEQWYPYKVKGDNIEPVEAFKALIKEMERLEISKLEEKSSLFILPGYNFNVVEILLTNFHQPNSTLLLLIAAFIGEEWRTLYNYALENQFRFLSYGDSSLLFRKNSNSTSIQEEQ